MAICADLEATLQANVAKASTRHWRHLEAEQRLQQLVHAVHLAQPPPLQHHSPPLPEQPPLQHHSPLLPVLPQPLQVFPVSFEEILKEESELSNMDAKANRFYEGHSILRSVNVTVLKACDQSI